MASSPVVEPTEKAAAPAVDLATKPTTDEALEETSSAQAQDSGSATSLSNTSSSTRNLDIISDTATASPGEVADDTEGAEAANEAADEANGTANKSEEAKETEVPASPPPLPDEPLPEEEDDGWDPMWSDEHQAWYFYNRITQQTQWDNPRAPADGATGGSAGSVAAGGYNPAIHGDYDPTAWYATGGVAPEQDDAGLDEAAIAAAAAAAAAAIQSTDPSTFRNSKPDVEFGGGHRYTHEAKSGRQLNAYFDVQANTNEHDGRSLKAERSGIKPTKAELKAFKEKRRAKKEEKRRAWLRD